MPLARYTTGTTRQPRTPWSRKKRIAVAVAGCIGAISIGGITVDATRSPADQQYKTCIDSGYSKQHCYDDVWHRNTPTPTSQPNTPPASPTSKPSPAPIAHGHFTFCAECPLDATQVIDMRARH